jgi:hypothetical protein
MRAAQLVVALAVATVGIGPGHGIGLGVPVDAQGGAGAWPFHIEFTHPFAEYASYQLCVGEACQPLWAFPLGSDVWRAPMPQLPPGEHRLVVKACNFNGCLPGTPDLMVRVTQPEAGRRPPITVVEGPRIPARRR